MNTRRCFGRLDSGVATVSLIAQGLAGTTLVGCGDSNSDSQSIASAAPGAPGSGPNPDPGARTTACPGIELPERQHYVAPGLCARAVALGQGALRQITFASNGDLIGVRGSGEVLRYRDEDADGRFLGAEITEVANTGGNGNNAHLDEAAGYVYAGSPDGVVRFEYSPDGPLGAAEPIVTGQPSSGTHSLHTAHVFDGWLYVHSGSEDNAVAPALPDYDAERSVLKRFELAQFAGTPFDWSEGEVFVTGLRNMVGYARNADGDLYGVVNGIDNLRYRGSDIHLNNPGEDLVRLRAGEAHGYPYCFTAQHVPEMPALGVAGSAIEGETSTAVNMIAAGTRLATEVEGMPNPHDDAWCLANSAPPSTFLEAHSAPLDITFFEGDSSGALPSDWQGGAFVTQHGSWNTEPSVGHRVLFVPFDDSGAPPMPTAAASGPQFPFTVVFGGGSAESARNGEWGWQSGEVGEDPVRPVGVAISPIDGALYVSSDNATGGIGAPNGAIYRIRVADGDGIVD
jgi:glucose/arabinose dehydrogenase